MEQFCARWKDCVTCAVKACYWLAGTGNCHFRQVNGTGIADQLLCAGRSGAATTTTTTAATIGRPVRATPLSLLSSFAEPSPLVQGLTEREIVLIILLAVVSALFLVLAVVLLLLKLPTLARLWRNEPVSLDAERLVESSTDASSSISNHPAHVSTPLPRPATTSEDEEEEEQQQQQQQHLIPRMGARGTQTVYFSQSESSASSNGGFDQVELTPPRVLRPRPVATPQRYPP